MDIKVSTGQPTRDGSPQKRPGKAKSRKYRELWKRPGYLVRRLHQIHMGLFAEECSGEDLTPIQFGILTVLQNGEEMDQLTLSTSVGIDRTSGADVIRRLERRGYVTREPSDRDRRAKIIRITDLGKDCVSRVRPMMVRAQERLIGSLNDEEREEFLRMIEKLVNANNEASRAPLGTV